MNAKYWVSVGSAFGIGAILGAVAMRIRIEAVVRSEYAESTEALERVIRSRLDLDEALRQVANEEASVSIFEDDIVVTALSEEIQVVKSEDEPVRNDYHKMAGALATPNELYISGGVNDYGVSYIEDEEFEDDDGRVKNHVDMVMDTTLGSTLFYMDGEPLDDWDTRLGNSIVVDFYNLVPPGVDPVLYVRNHRTDEDYAVVRIVS